MEQSQILTLSGWDYCVHCRPKDNWTASLFTIISPGQMCKFIIDLAIMEVWKRKGTVPCCSPGIVRQLSFWCPVADKRNGLQGTNLKPNGVIIQPLQCAVIHPSIHPSGIHHCFLGRDTVGWRLSQPSLGERRGTPKFFTPQLHLWGVII